MYPRKDFVGVQPGAFDVEGLVPVGVGDRERVGLQGVADDDRAWGDIAVQEGLEVHCVDLVHYLQAATAECFLLGFHSDHNVGLARWHRVRVFRQASRPR
jgi:hypothetical protein